jgi:hypothetical protein
MQRATVLSEAGQAVADRGLNYGSPEDNFARIARLWNAHLNNVLAFPIPEPWALKPSDVALMMAQVKMARLANDPTHADSWVDIAGYAACGGEVSGAGVKVVEHESNEALEALMASRAPWEGDLCPGGIVAVQDAIRHTMTEAAPETKFGFTIGEKVNWAEAPSGHTPGRVTGFTENAVLLKWSDAGSDHAWAPEDLRHGP